MILYCMVWVIKSLCVNIYYYIQHSSNHSKNYLSSKLCILLSEVNISLYKPNLDLLHLLQILYTKVQNSKRIKLPKTTYFLESPLVLFTFNREICIGISWLPMCTCYSTLVLHYLMKVFDNY